MIQKIIIKLIKVFGKELEKLTMGFSSFKL